MPRAFLLQIALLAGALQGAMPAALVAQDSAVVAPAPDSVMKADTVAAAAHDSALRADTSAIPARSQALSTSGLKDSVDRKRPVGPGGALWRSLLVPGWGQAKLGRGIAAGLFIAVEGVTLGMVLKTNSELNYAKSTDTTAVANKSQEREDWLVIMAVNHLVAGLEAYVSAHLWDFPGDLALKPVRGGGVAASVTFPMPVP